MKFVLLTLVILVAQTIAESTTKDFASPTTTIEDFTATATHVFFSKSGSSVLSISESSKLLSDGTSTNIDSIPTSSVSTNVDNKDSSLTSATPTSVSQSGFFTIYTSAHSSNTFTTISSSHTAGSVVYSTFTGIIPYTNSSSVSSESLSLLPTKLPGESSEIVVLSSISSAVETEALSSLSFTDVTTDVTTDASSSSSTLNSDSEITSSLISTSSSSSTSSTFTPTSSISTSKITTSTSTSTTSTSSTSSSTSSPSTTTTSTSTTSTATTSSSSLSAIEQGILDKHNNYRSLHGVPNLSWSAELTEFANEYIKQISTTTNNACSGNLVHSSREGKNYGENLAYGNIDSLIAVELWYNEISLYNFEDPANSSGDFESYGHFTQLIWKSSTELGCVVHDCGSGRVYVICEYSPQGNVFLSGDPYYYFKLNVPPPI